MYANAYPENGDGTNTKIVAPDSKSLIPESQAPTPDSNIPASDAKASLRGGYRRRYPFDHGRSCYDFF